MITFDVGNKHSRDRLHRAKETSRTALEPFRIARATFLRDYAGSWYSRDAAPLLTYVNKLNLTARIYATALAFNNPQYKVTSFAQNLRPFCRKFQTNINSVVENIDLKTTFQYGILDAFFLVGVFYTRMADDGFVLTEDNVWVNPGKPWVDRISLDDLIIDMGVKDPRAVRFIGHKYRAPYDGLMARDDYDAKVKKHLRPSSKEGVDEDDQRASAIASGSAVDDDELEPMVWVEEIFLPETRQVVTLSGDNDTLPPLKVEESDAGPLGPYDLLCLGLMPDNVMPVSPASILKPLHDLSNRLYRKLAAEADRQKVTFAYPPGGDDDAKRHRTSVDGEYWKCRDPKNIVPVVTPGVDGNTNAFFLAAQELYNIQSGNERALGGLGLAAGTLGQEELLMGQAVGMIAGMKGAVYECASRIGRKIGCLMFDDEYLEVPSSAEAENTGYWLDTTWRPGDRQGLKDHYKFSVHPNSMNWEPPEAKWAKKQQFLQVLTVNLPLVQAGLLDVQEFTRQASEDLNCPELQKLFRYMAQQAMGSGDPHQATKPAVTSREVVRRSEATGPSSDGMATVLSQLMQGRGNGQQGNMVGA